MSDRDRKPVIDAIFGINGVSAAQGRVVFEERVAHALSIADATFGLYFNSRIVPMLKHNLDTTLEVTADVSTKWTNNNCESANHMLKVAVDWKPQSLLGLIEKLHEVVVSQYEVERAIINTGDYKLAPLFQKYKVHRDAWREMTEQARQSHLDGFRSGISKAANAVVSSDNTTTVVLPGHGGKKIGQESRKGPNRTK